MIFSRTKLFILTVLLVGFFNPAEAQDRVRRNVEVEWESNDNASGYEIQVTRKDDVSKKPLVFKTKTPQWSATIKPGLYKMQVRALDDRGVPGSWSDPAELLVKLPAVFPIKPESKKILSAKEEVKEEVSFQWAEVPGASKYIFKAVSIDGAWSHEKELTETSLSTEVPVASAVQWEVVAFDAKGEEGDKWKTPEAFELHGPELASPAIQKPISEFIREINWSVSPYATSYRYDLQYYNRKIKKWELIESKTDLTERVIAIDSSRPTGTYRLEVQAQTDKRAASQRAKLDFKMRGGFRTPASLDNAILRDSITKPTNYYFIASYFTTQVQYQFSNYDKNSNVSFDALGAVGRVGLGYQNPRSSWGTFGIADVSAFIIGGETFNFTSFELHATRSLRVSGAGKFLLGTGLYMRELPMVEGTNTTGFNGAGKVSSIGPHIGFTYWVPMTDSYGVQLNGRGYYSLKGSTPAGDLAPSLSYQMGILGSYRLTSAWMGFLGYAYRMDSVNYETMNSSLSFAQPGQENELTFKGHFLNLLFEYSF